MSKATNIHNVDGLNYKHLHGRLSIPLQVDECHADATAQKKKALLNATFELQCSSSISPSLCKTHKLTVEGFLRVLKTGPLIDGFVQ